MTTAYLVSDLQFYEGEPGSHAPALVAYQDTMGVWTIGFGHTGPEVVEGLTCTYAQALAWLMEDIEHAQHDLDLDLAWWRTLDDVRQDVMVEMRFILGIGGLLEFHHTLADEKTRDWVGASAQILMSELAHEDGNRIKILAKEMLTGIHLPPGTVV